MTEPRLTSARKAILDILKTYDTHLSAAEVHEKLLERLPSLNISTVYRSLDYLVEHNLISVADIGTGTPVYEQVGVVPHHHLVCLNCRKIMDMEHELVAPFFEVLENDKDFTIETNHLVLYGICRDCKNNH